MPVPPLNPKSLIFPILPSTPSTTATLTYISDLGFRPTCRHIKIITSPVDLAMIAIVNEHTIGQSNNALLMVDVMVKYIAYYRCSTQKQTASGLGLEAQRAAVNAYICGREHQLIAEYTETESGRNSDRPKLAEALADAKRRRATLVIARLDRLARSVMFVASLMESGVAFVACDMVDASPLFLHIMAAVAEAEAKAISERTKAALAAARARGVKLGGPNILDAQRLARESIIKKADDLSAGLIPIIKQMVDRGENSSHRIAAELQRLGIKTARNKNWHGITVLKMLKRQGYSSLKTLSQAG